jgi:hypothetical protein
MDVFGMVTVRDVMDMDRSRNIIFARPRSNCQTIMEEVTDFSILCRVSSSVPMRH